jgi:hypothetical protein
MVIYNYFDKVAEGIEFLMAVGSLLGLFGLLYGLAAWFNTTPKGRGKLMKLFFVSLGLISICGIYTGFKYFGI